jgi:hypothetical protein
MLASPAECQFFLQEIWENRWSVKGSIGENFLPPLNSLSRRPASTQFTKERVIVATGALRMIS